MAVTNNLLEGSGIGSKENGILLSCKPLPLGVGRASAKMKGRTPFQECGLCKEILRGYQSLELNPCSYGEVTARARGIIFNE